MNIVPETRSKTVLDIVRMIIGVKLIFLVDISLIKECVFQGNKSLLVLSSTRSEIESGTWHHSFILQIAFIYSKQISSVQFTLFGIWALKLIRLMHSIN